MTTRRAPRQRAPKSHRDALGSVETLPSGRYRARYSRDGVTFKAPHTFATKDAALTWLATERADRARGAWLDPRLGAERLTEFADTFLDSRPFLAPRTREIYRLMLDKYILPKVGIGRGVELGTLPLAEITPAVVRSWQAALLATVRERIASRAAGAQRRGKHPARVWALSIGHPRAHPSGCIATEIMEAWRAAGSPDLRATDEHTAEIEDVSTEPGRVTVVNAYRVLRTVMNAAVQDGLITTSPCRIPGAGTNHHPERPTATPEEVAVIAEHMPPHLSAAVLLAAWSGLRFGEVFALARQHVDLEAGTVRVERALVNVQGEPVRFGKPKTHSSRRTVHLPQFVTDALRAHLAKHVAPSGAAMLFKLPNGQPLTPARLSRYYRAARAAAGRDDLRFHDLRHTGATLAYSAGASVREVQNRLGHSTMRAASIYAHAADDSDAVLANRLDALYSPSRDTPTPPEPVNLTERRRAA